MTWLSALARVKPCKRGGERKEGNESGKKYLKRILEEAIVTETKVRVLVLKLCLCEKLLPTPCKGRLANSLVGKL